MAGISLKEALSEIEHTKNECLELIEQLDAFSPPNASGEYHPTFRLMATPMLYSAWERCFTLCNSISLRLIRERTSRAHDLPPGARALWLQAATFFQSFSSKVYEAPDVGGALDSKGTLKPGRFRALSQFLKELDDWSVQPLDHRLITDDLVMTFSNVNPKVVDINAEAIGIAAFPQFQQLKLGRLHDLVGRRNEIGHGAIIQPPSNSDFCDLRQFTIDIVRLYCDIYATWLNEQYSLSSGVARMLNILNGIPARFIALLKTLLWRRTG